MRLTLWLTLIGILLGIDLVDAVQVACGRRASFGHFFGAALVCGGNTLDAGAVPPERGAPTEAPPCIFGEGEGCSAAADSPIIKELQQRSAQNKEKYEAQMLDRYNYNNVRALARARAAACARDECARLLTTRVSGLPMANARSIRITWVSTTRPWSSTRTVLTRR